MKKIVFLNPNGHSHSWLVVCQIMIINVLIPPTQLEVSLRQEGHVYRSRGETRPPSARRAMFIEAVARRARPPPGGPCL